jgi:hypothetical protein
MNRQTQLAFVAFLSLVLLSPFMALYVKAQDDDFTLEAEQNWDTYGVGGTCIYGTHNIFIADVNDDGIMEIVTGGFTYNTINGSRTGSQAPLKVWNWDGHNVTLKASIKWNGSIACLYAADLDGDNIAEIITSGSFRNEAGNNTSSLRIWNMRNGELNLEAHFEGTSINSLFVSDADKDGTPEILSVGRLPNSNLNTSQLSLWAFKDSTLTLDKNIALDAANITSANSVYTSDLDNDGNQEVVIGGYSDNLANSKGQLTIWQWNGQEFILKANKTWQLAGGTAKTIAGGTQGNTAVYNVKAGDLDGDGYKEIVTGGFAYDGEKVNAQVKIWSWVGNTLAEKASQEWATDYLTEVKCLSLNDVDDDGKMDIVESGIVAAQGSFKNSESIHDRGQLRVYGWDGTTLTLKQSKDWTFDDGACAWNVANGDVDKDGFVEIITVGCTALNELCDPDMRIWSLPSIGTTSNYLPYVLAGVLLAATAFSVLVFFTRKKKVTPV